MTRRAPRIASKVRWISSSRAWVSTWMVTSSGIRSSSISSRMKAKIRLGGARESHLDLLEAELDELLEQAPLALGTHGLDQGLVAIAQVDAAPDRWPLDHAVRPAPIGQVDRREGLVLGGGHARHGSLQVRRGVRLEREASQREDPESRNPLRPGSAGEGFAFQWLSRSTLDPSRPAKEQAASRSSRRAFFRYAI